jgi:chemotaxis protein CheZ
MTDLPVPAAPTLDAAEFDMIHEAVQETFRGRWFLAEYARRMRSADTLAVLSALERMEARLSAGKPQAQAAVAAPAPATGYDRLKLDIMDMAEAIARTKVEIAGMRPPGEEQGRIAEASVELDAIVTTTATATSDILAAAEQVQEIAWTLREQGFEGEVCDILDAKATDIYTACSFQDLTGQRTRKVIGLLADLEGRIDAMVDIWSGGEPAPAAEKPARADRHLLNGPALPGQGLDQGDVDTVMQLRAAQPEAVAVTPVIVEPGPDDAIEPDDAPAGPPEPVADVAAPPLAPTLADALKPLDRLSADERLAYFS